MSTGNACFTKAPSFSPKNYPGLVAWYNVDSAIINNKTLDVLGLRDKSGNNNTLIMSNGTASINIDDPLGIPYTNNLHINTTPLEFAKQPTGLTVFLVATNNTDNEKYQNYLTIFEDENNNPIKIGIDNVEDTIYINSDTYQNGVIIRNLNPNTSNIINAICFNSFIDLRSDDVSSAATYQNGLLMYYIDATTILRINKATNTLKITIGDDGLFPETGQPHTPLNNIIYEIIIYNHVLSESDISKINRYLGEKYNIELKNEGNFTYKENL